MSAQDTVHLEVRKLTGSLGAEIRGVDLHAPINKQTQAALRNELLNHLVIFFPGQKLSSAELKAFGATWGDLVTYSNAPASQEDPDVVEMISSKGDSADMWHTDVTWQRDPAQIAILSMVKTPPKGGDTMWSNQYDAYEGLSAPIRKMLDGLTAIHRFPVEFVRKDRPPPTLEGVEHPIVRVHPETGRRFLFISRQWVSRIPQLSRGESDALLAQLFAHSVDPRFTLRYRWTEGTTAVWDNRCTQHMVVVDFDGERIIQRVTAGKYPFETMKSPWPHFSPKRRSVLAKLEDYKTS